MEKLHTPESRSWISEKLKPSEILEEYAAQVASLKPYKSISESTLKSQHLKEMIGITEDETFKEGGLSESSRLNDIFMTYRSILYSYLAM